MPWRAPNGSAAVSSLPWPVCFSAALKPRFSKNGSAGSRTPPWGPLPAPCLQRGPGEQLWPGSPSEPPHCCVAGLAFFGCVGADANVTAGHGAEGLSCGMAESCAGKGARGQPPARGEGVLSGAAAWHRTPPRTRVPAALRGWPGSDPPWGWTSSGMPPGRAVTPGSLGWGGGFCLSLSPAGNATRLRRQGHFSRCPEEYKHYCVKGRCRFLVAEKAPACV